MTLLMASAGTYHYLSKGNKALVVYCAHDALFSESILNKFQQETGIPLVVKYDTEATKSLGLIELILREQAQPHCEVFWNNELLGMMDLKEKGLLEAYKGSGYQRIPSNFKDSEGYWSGFAARLRVVIVNTQQYKGSLDSIPSSFVGNLSQVAIANPLYGTTLTHFCVLAKQWGLDRLKQWRQDTKNRGLKVVRGNAAVRDHVAKGSCTLGWTDTDDYFQAVDNKKPVTMTPWENDQGQVVFIPNTVALIKGVRHRKEAQQLIDYLLSAETEIALANSSSRQIPLGPVDDTKISDEVKKLQPYINKATSLNDLNQHRRDLIELLRPKTN